MTVAQALAIAAAAWVTAVAADPSMTASVYQARAKADLLVAKLESVTAIRLQQIGGGFRATPDGLCMERTAALR